MSGICGFFHRRAGAPVDQRLQSMLGALRAAGWGPDGGAVWQAGALGLGCLRLDSTDEARYEHLPQADPGSRLVFTASARLDNRAELCDELAIPWNERSQTPDSSLILRLWQRQGQACLPRLYGDWAFALWDEKRQELWLARDPNGVTSLFYYLSPEFCAFASGLHGLLALPEVPRRLNEVELARQLLLLPHPAGPTATCYRDIFDLPPAYALRIGPDASELFEYWRVEDTPPTRLPSDEAYVETFLELYDQAVRARLRSPRPVGIALSSGLDSLSVAALAAPALAQNNQPLRAYTSVPLYPDARPIARRYGDEWPLAQAALAQMGPIQHQPIQAAQLTPLQGTHRMVQILGQAQMAVSNHYWLIALLEQARQDGVGVLLTGQHGNATVSWHGGKPDIWALLRRGRVLAAWRTLSIWRSCSAQSWPQVLNQTLLRPLTGDHFQPGGKVQQQAWQNSILQADFIAQAGLAEQLPSWPANPPRSNTAATLDEHAALYRAGRRSGGMAWQPMTAAYQMEMRDPTCDQRLVQFCYSIPQDQFLRLGRPRWLLRRAMQGRIPPAVLWNPLRGHQGVDIVQRLLADSAGVESALDEMSASPLALSILDLNKIRRAWQALPHSAGVNDSLRLSRQLLTGIAAGWFLQGLEVG